ncbi:hypothetical protein [Gordonia sp. SND2]|uniref:hypothetical protein n=1 Tax=Gordonia sp. SND2 TaxID=3388659 RepID=UPI00398AE946
MPWFKVDDALHSHPKARRAGLEAMGLWAIAGSHCMAYLTDGFVERWVVESWPNGPELAERLVDAGLWVSRWDTHRESRVVSGWEYCDWSQYQPMKADVEESRRRERERKAEWRESKKPQVKASDSICPSGTTEGTPGGSPGGSHSAPTRPNPIKKKEASEAFNDWWASYPRKVGKKAASTAFARALKDIDATSLIAAAKAYSRANTTTDPKYIALPTTWLNQGRWDEFSENATDPTELLRECWKTGSLGKVIELTGWQPPIFHHPEDPTVDKEIALRDHVRQVIDDNREELIMRLKEVS